jgi:pSer/pThr/pTyr-binding forkhead associated (FHA) protein
LHDSYPPVENHSENSNTHSYPLGAILLSESCSYNLGKISTKIGRIVKNELHPVEATPLDSTYPDMDESNSIADLQISSSRLISRKHIEIHFDPMSKAWFLSVYGKNGVTINGNLYRPPSAPILLPKK